jgi:hypothetical protein
MLAVRFPADIPPVNSTNLSRSSGWAPKALRSAASVLGYSVNMIAFSPWI